MAIVTANFGTSNRVTGGGLASTISSTSTPIITGRRPGSAAGSGASSSSSAFCSVVSVFGGWCVLVW